MQRQQESSRKRARPRVLCGLRVSAGIEIVVFLAVVTMIGMALGIPDRFTGISPHPYWIVVILIASCYGTAEGLLAAALATGVLLIGNMPEQAFDETLGDWLLRTTTLPVSWFLTAAVLGEIRSGHMRAHDEAVERLQSLHAQAERIAAAYEDLAEAKFRLEQRIATQKQTLRAAYEASCLLDQPRVSDVFAGAPAFVTAMLRPRNFSIFVLEGDRLDAVTGDVRMAKNGYAAASPLFHAIIHDRRHLLAADPADEAILQEEGVLAGPLIDEVSGQVFGMLKVEEIDFSNLTPSTVLDFRAVCAWIGKACANASRLEERTPAFRDHVGGPEYPLVPGDSADLETGGSNQIAPTVALQLASASRDHAPLQDETADEVGQTDKVVSLRGRWGKAGHVVS